MGAGRCFLMWAGWPVDRILYLFLAVVAFAVFVQVALFHWRQNFRHWSMWVPVAGMLAQSITAGMLAMRPDPALISVFVGLGAIAVASGLVGTYFHLAGVGERVDGYTLNNFMVGPPPALPLLVSAVGALGVITVYML